MITEDYVSFETARLLKENGFDGDTNCYYIEGSVDKNLYYSPIRENHNKRITNNEFDVYIDITSSRISAPTLQMAMKWLREAYHIHILPQISDPSQVNPKYYIVIWTTGLKRESYILELFNSYEEAVEEGIKYCLENLIEDEN